MAQTLNPRASVFHPCHGREFDALDYDFYLPESLLVSPSRKSVGNCDPGEYRPVSNTYYPARPKYSDYDDYRFMDTYMDYPEDYGLYDDNYFSAPRAHHRGPEYPYAPNVHCSRRNQPQPGPYYPSPSSHPRKRSPPHRQNSNNSNSNSVTSRSTTSSSPHQQPTRRPNYASVAKQSPSRKPTVRPAPAAAPGTTITTTASSAPSSVAGSSCSGSTVDPILPPSNPVVHRTPSYDDDCELHLIRSQLETYFSDKNLYEEQHSNLQYYMKLDKDRWVPLHVVCSLPAIRKIPTANEQVVLKALRSSNLLELNSTEDKVRRPNYFAPSDYKVRKNLRRSVLVYGIPEQMTDKELRELLDMHGNILCIAFCGMIEGPEKEIAELIMAKKFNEHLNLTNLKSAFVVFESQSQANKCVKARSRSAADNIRTMHKYDYNKVVKRIGKGQSPLFSSVHNKPAHGELPPKSFHLTPTNPQRTHVSNRRTFGKSMTWKPTKANSLNWRERPTMQTRSNSLQNRRNVSSDCKRFGWMRKDTTGSAWNRKENRGFMQTHV